MGIPTQVTVVWQDYYAISVSSVPPSPMLLSWSGARQCGRQLWYTSEPSTAALSGIGCPGNVISASACGVLLGSCTVGADGQWALTLNSSPQSGLISVSITEADIPDGTSASSTILLQVGGSYAGTAASVQANLDALQSLVAGGCVLTITLTNSMTPTITVTAAQAANDGEALGCIAGPHYITVTGVAAGNAAAVASQPSVNAILVCDSLANIAANLPALEALAVKGTLRGIALDDTAVPTLTLTALQVSAGALALSLITGTYNLGITQTAATIPNATVTGIIMLGQNSPQITLSDATGTQAWSRVIVVLDLSGQIASEDFYWHNDQPDAETSYVYTNDRIYQTWQLPFGGGYVMTENDLTGTQQWSSFVQTVNASNQLISLDYKMRCGQAYAESLVNFSNAAVSSETDSFWSGGYQTTTYDLVGTQLWSSEVESFNTLRGLVSRQYNWRMGQPYISSTTFYDPVTEAVTAQVSQALNGSRIASNVAASSLSTVVALQNLASVSFVDTSANFTANIGILESLAVKGDLASVNFTDGSLPTLTLAASSISTNTLALSCIGGPFNLVATSVSAVGASGVAALPNVVEVLISDTAADVQASLGSLEALAAAGKLGTITLTDAARPTFTLTAPQVTADAAALALVAGAYAINVTGVTAANAASAAAQPHVAQVSVSDTAADVQASLGSLETLAAAGELGTITLTDAAKPTFTLTASQVTADAAALALVAGAYAINVTGVTAANAASAAAQPHVAKVSVSDTAADVQASLGSLETLAAAGELGTITLTDAARPSFTLTAAQAAAAAPVLAAISSPYSLSETGVAAAAAAAVAAQPGVVQVSVSDTAADVQASLGSLEALAAAGKLGTITLTDAARPTFTLTASQVTADAAALALVAGAYAINVTGVTAASAASAAAQPHVSRVSVSDVAANVLACIGTLETLAAAGELGTITLTDAARPSFTLTAAQAAAAAPVLAAISSPYSLSETGVAAAAAAAVAAQPGVVQVSVSDTAADVQASLGSLEALAAAGKLGTITLTDAARPSFTLTAARRRLPLRFWQRSAAHTVLARPASPPPPPPPSRLSPVSSRSR